jgi:hypothetical protein
VKECSSKTCKRSHDTLFKLCPACRAVRYRYKKSEKSRVKAQTYRSTEQHRALHRAGMARYRLSDKYLDWVQSGDRAAYERCRRVKRRLDLWDRKPWLERPRGLNLFNRLTGFTFTSAGLSRQY